MGTATPVHYHCLFDSTNMPLEIMENITYKMTYYYWNWNGPVREPAALKFAETCNNFVRNIKIGDNVNDKLNNSPYYI
jgi:aubergine-like protein